MDALLQWCSKLIEPVPGRRLGLSAVAGDASFRRYFRLDEALAMIERGDIVDAKTIMLLQYAALKLLPAAPA